MRRDLAQQPTLGAHGGVIGRPRREPPADAAERIMQAAAAGRGIVGCAHQLGTSHEMMKRWMQADPRLAFAFEVGKEIHHQELVDLMLRDARDNEKPNVNAMFLLKTRHGYREGDAGDTGRVHVTVNLPGSLSPSEFLKTVAGDGR